MTVTVLVTLAFLFNLSSLVAELVSYRFFIHEVSVPQAEPLFFED